MQAGPALGVGLVELLILLSGGGLTGTPPGDRDPALLKCPPAQCVMYSEWAERGPGQSGAPGIDGLVAEPEVREFARRLEQAIIRKIEFETAQGDDREKTIGAVLPRVVSTLLSRPGCLYITFDEAAAANPPEAGPSPQANALIAGLRITLIASAGNDADDIDSKLRQIVATLPDAKKSLDHQSLLELPNGPALTLHRHEKYFILGLGQGTVDAAVNGLKGEVKGLAEDERFTSAIGRVAVARTAAVSWIDVKRLYDVSTKLRESAGGADVAAMAASVGLDKLESIASTTGVVDGQIRTRTFLNTGGNTRGLLVLAAGRGMKAPDFDQVPADADFVTAISVDPARLLETAQQFAAIGGPNSREQFDNLIKELELNIDATFEGHIFPGFGNVIVVHNSPSAGGILFTGLVGSLEVVDRNKAYLAFTGMLDYLQGALEDNVGNDGPVERGRPLRKERFMDETMWFVNTMGRETFFAPTFCMTESKLLIAAHPQAMKAHIRFLKEKSGATFASKIGKEIPVNDGELFFASYLDSKSFVHHLYSIAPYVGQAAVNELQREGLNIDVYALPSAPAILPYLQPSYSTAVRTRDGLLLESQSLLPIPGASVGLSVLPWFIAVPVRAQRIEVQDAVPVDQLVPEAAPEVAPADSP